MESGWEELNIECFVARSVKNKSFEGKSPQKQHKDEVHEERY